MSSQVHHLRKCVFTATHMAMSLLATAALSAEPPTANSISKALASQRDQIKSGIVTFRLDTIADPRRKPISRQYTAYFNEVNFRVDEVLWDSAGKPTRVWKLYTPPLALQSFASDDASIQLQSTVGIGLEDMALGIIDPRHFGIQFQLTESLMLPAIDVLCAANISANSVAEPATIDEHESWKITTALNSCTWQLWVARSPICVLKQVAFCDGRIHSELVCDHDPSLGALTLPTKLIYRQFDEAGQVIREERTTVEKQRLNVAIPDETFQIAALGIPAGRSVLNLIDGSRQQLWDGKNLVDPDGPSERLEPAARNYSFVMGLSVLLLALCAVKLFRMISGRSQKL